MVPDIKLETCQRLAEIIVNKFITYKPEIESQDSMYYATNDSDLIRLITSIYKVLHVTHSQILLETVAGHIITHPDYYNIDFLIEAIKKLHSWFYITSGDEIIPAFNMLVHHVIQALETIIRSKLSDSWVQDISWMCCTDCSKLQTFLKSPTDSKYRFSAVQNRRTHLERQIYSHNCDLRLDTESGSPKTLVCTKKKEVNLKRRLLKERNTSH